MRHPMTIASSLATLNDASHGRVIFGIGTGYPDALNKIGIERQVPLTRAKEFIQLVRALQAGETVTFSGSVFNFRNAKFGFESKMKIPVILGTGQGPNILRLAGEICEGAIMSETTDDMYANRVSLIREGLSKANKNPDDFRVILDIMISVGKTRKEAIDSLRPWMKTRIGKKAGAVKIMDLTEELAAKYYENPSTIP